MTLFDPDDYVGSKSTYPASAAADRVEVLRPIQYLGNKQRSLQTILSVLDALVPTDGSVADLFTGTSVVAQGIAGLKRRAVAVDVSHACAMIASASLGVGRSADVDGSDLSAILEDEARKFEERLSNVWEKQLEAERTALASDDGWDLLELDRNVPQVWRSDSAPADVRKLFSDWEHAAESGSGCLALLSPVFAGTYFGVRQAVQLDSRRAAVASLVDRQVVDPWEQAALITALLAAASAAAFSPGKHFAQPHRTDGDKDLTFHAGRVLSDRAVSVADTAADWIERLAAATPLSCEGHEVLRMTVDDLVPDDLVAREVTAVYADPPYTAQQYSRFYHVLDTLAEGAPRPLQRVKGKVTSGLYPDGRYLSPYCRKSQARPAFSRLAALCRDAGSSLLLSYSASAKSSTGNARMISLPALLDVLASQYGRSAIEIVEFQHQYRQFNHRDVARATRSDPEVMVIAHAP